MEKVKGFINSADIIESSKKNDFTKSLNGIAPHIVWLCPSCDSVNINFDINQKEDECSECHKKFLLEIHKKDKEKPINENEIGETKRRKRKSTKKSTRTRKSKKTI